MAVVYRSSGTFASAAQASSGATASCSPGMPAGFATDDFLLLRCEAFQSASSPSVGSAPSAPSGWTLLADTTAAGTGAGGAASATRLTTFWRRAVAGDAAPIVAAVNDHIDAQIDAFPGVDWTAFTASPSSFFTTSSTNGTNGSTSVSFASISTTVASALIVLVLANTLDQTTTTTGTITNSTLTGTFTATSAGNTTAGNGGGTTVWGGLTKATSGATGASTTTVATSTQWAALTLVLPPSTGGGGAAPVYTTAPTVTSNTIFAGGAVLTTDNGMATNSPTSYTYQWNLGGTAISGATSATYASRTTDLAALTCTVIATNAGGSASSTSNAVTLVRAQSYSIAF